MSKQKSGLIIFTIAYLIQIVFSVFSSIDSVTLLVNIGNWGALVAFIVELVGLGIAGRENLSLRNAFWGIILQLVLTITVVILLIVAAGQNPVNETLVNVSSWLSVAISVIDIFVLCSVVDGCAEASEKVKGMAKVIDGFILLAVVLVAAFKIIALYNADASVVMGIVAIVVTLIYEILIIIILLRTIPKLK